MAEPKYQRVLLKLSGEVLAGDQGFGIDPDRASMLAETVRSVHEIGVHVAVVIGAGNLWRGAAEVARGMNRSTADHMGMIATVMNALALQDALQQIGVESRVQTAIEMRKVAEPYIRLRAIRHMEKGRVVILGGGTGNPYFTTDTAGALRAMEVDADILIKATKVEGIYDSDPSKNPNARMYRTISFDDAIAQRLRVMDGTAFELCRENALPIAVMNLFGNRNVSRFVCGETVGTMVGDMPTVLAE